MACSKYTLFNTGSTPTYFNYQRCDDALWEYQVELLPNQIKNIWVLGNTYSSAFRTGVEIVSQGPFPAPSTTPTQSVTPTNSSTPDPSASQTPTVTPTNTETPTVTPTNTETPTMTPTTTETPTMTPTTTETPTPTTTQTPTNTSTTTETPTNTPTTTQTPTQTITPTKNCLTWQYSIDQGDVDNAFGNSSPSLNGRLFGGFISCFDNGGFQPNFTAAGNYNYCVTFGTTPQTPFGYNNDILFTASASTANSIGSC